MIQVAPDCAGCLPCHGERCLGLAACAAWDFRSQLCSPSRLARRAAGPRSAGPSESSCCICTEAIPSKKRSIPSPTARPRCAANLARSPRLPRRAVQRALAADGSTRQPSGGDPLDVARQRQSRHGEFAGSTRARSSARHPRDRLPSRAGLTSHRSAPCSTRCGPPQNPSFR